MKTYTTNSAKETQILAQKLAKEFSARIFLLTGELGTGKTTFIQGFAKALGIRNKIISPTFVLVRQYPIPNTQKTLYHIDLYRLENNTEFQQLGLCEILANPNNIVLIEWAEKLNILSKGAVKISIEKGVDNQRRIIIHYS